MNDTSSKSLIKSSKYYYYVAMRSDFTTVDVHYTGYRSFVQPSGFYVYFLLMFQPVTGTKFQNFETNIYHLPIPHFS